MPAGQVPLLWPGRTIYIAGAGPSFTPEIADALRGRPVIAINRMFEQLPTAGIVYFSDLRCWKWYGAAMLRHPGLKLTCERRIDHPEVTTLVKAGISGLAEHPGTICHGNNSGYAAINVAVHAGGARAVLLGMDMRLGPNGEQHCHEDHPVELRECTFPKMLPWFSSLVDPLTARGFEVLNATPGSAIDCFPRTTVERALALA